MLSFASNCLTPFFFKIGNLSVRRSSTVAGDVRKIVDSLIASNKVVVFSKSYCPYSKKAKQALNSYKIESKDYYVWEIDKEPNCAEIQGYLKSLTGALTVPRVFINGKFIGGGDDTWRMHTSGELAKLLKK